MSTFTLSSRIAVGQRGISSRTFPCVNNWEIAEQILKLAMASLSKLLLRLSVNCWVQNLYDFKVLNFLELHWLLLSHVINSANVQLIKSKIISGTYRQMSTEPLHPNLQHYIFLVRNLRKCSQCYQHNDKLTLRLYMTLFLASCIQVGAASFYVYSSLSLFRRRSAWCWCHQSWNLNEGRERRVLIVIICYVRLDELLVILQVFGQFTLNWWVCSFIRDYEFTSS